MKLDADFRALMPKLTKDEYAKLERSIIDEGCRDALIVWQEDDTLIDGYNRYEICQKHDIEFQTTFISCVLNNRDEVEEWIIDNQLGRRNLTVEQKTYLIGKKYKKEKQQHGGDRKSSSENELEGKASERIATEHKVSVGKVVNSEKFVDAVDVIAANVGDEVRDEILSRELDATQDDVKALAKQSEAVQKTAVEKARSGKTLKQATREAVKESNAEVETPPLPEGKYNVIYADPPWDIGSVDLEKWESPLDDKYPTMTTEELKELNIENLSGDDCVCFLWSTLTTLPDAVELLQDWGFKYHVTLTWDKGNGWCATGFHRKSELVLVGYKGKITRVVKQEGEYIPTVFYEAKTTHSTKPKIMYDFIEKHTVGKKIELFARLKYNDSWEVWGNQIHGNN